MTKRSADDHHYSLPDALIHASHTAEKTLVVNFACFITCLSNSSGAHHHTEGAPTTTPLGNLIVKMRIPGFELPCISAAVNRSQAIEIYMECDGLPLTKLLRALEEDMSLCCVAIFTFGSKPMINGAPDALARIRFRVERCGFTLYSKGTPTVGESLDFDIRDRMPNWVRFTADQMGLMLASDGSRPCEVVQWCVVQCFGDTSKLESQLKELRIRTGPCRQYYIKGLECMRTPTAARIYLEIEPVVKTVLLRCLLVELGGGSTSTASAPIDVTTPTMKVEIMTFPQNQQAKALAYVFDLGGVLIEQGNLSEVAVCRPNSAPCVITRFTQQDLAIWDCVVIEPMPVHWSVNERDAELAQLRADAVVLRMENSLLRNESTHYSQQCGRFLVAVEELKADRDQLRKELDFRKSLEEKVEAGNDSSNQQHYDGSLVGWPEWEMMRCSLEDRDRCIMQLKAQLGEVHDQILMLQRGELVADDLGRWICIGGNDVPLSALGHKIKALEQRLESEFEGGLAYDEERNKYVETGGRTWTRVQWQARELAIYRAVYGSITTRDSFHELDFAVKEDEARGGGVARCAGNECS